MATPDPQEPITEKQWKRFLRDGLIGVEAELDSTAPSSGRAALHRFQERLRETHSRRALQTLGHEVDAFLESEPHLKAAAGRYMAKIMVPALDKAMAVLTDTKRLLAKYKQRE